MKTRQDKDVTDCIVVVYAKSRLNYRDLLDCVQSMMKIKQDNNMIDYIGMVYIETKTKLLGSIESGVTCYQN